ncbi:MAG: hypothetical protein IKQ91_01515 [Oscillospiraceae bacterium]|nr:hypothetical protein [Oscillospiraceae bacterium]
MFEFLCLFGKKFRIFIAILLYLIAGAALFYFIPDTIDYLRARGRQTVSAEIISTEEHTNADNEREYRVTMQYVIDNRKYYYTEYTKNCPSGRQKLHVYLLADGNWAVYELNIGGILVLIGIAAASAVCGTRLILSCREKKEGTS